VSWVVVGERTDGGQTVIKELRREAEEGKREFDQAQR
jgi:hypothetical protein